MGHFNYTISPNAGAVTGTEIRNIAHITFDYLETIAGEAWTENLRRLGTPFLTEHQQTLGIWGAKNFQRGTIEGCEEISGEVFRQKFLIKPLGCMGCFIRCRRYAAIREGALRAFNRGGRGGFRIYREDLNAWLKAEPTEKANECE